MKRAVIVGCGNIAAVHAAVLTAQKDTELVGVADIHFEKAQDYAIYWKRQMPIWSVRIIAV